MGCNCGGSKFVAPTREQMDEADRAALAAARPQLRGRLAPGYTWDGAPAPEPAADAAKA